MNFSIGRWKPVKIYHKTVWRLLGDPARRDPTGFCKHGKMCVDFWPREHNDEFPLPRLDGHTNAAKVMRGHVGSREATDTHQAAGTSTPPPSNRMTPSVGDTVNDATLRPFSRSPSPARNEIRQFFLSAWRGMPSFGCHTDRISVWKWCRLRGAGQLRDESAQIVEVK